MFQKVTLKFIPYKVIFIVSLSIIAFHSTATYIYYNQTKNTILESLLNKSEYLARPITLSLNSKIDKSLAGFKNTVSVGLLELFAGAISINFKQITNSISDLNELLLVKNNKIIAHHDTQKIGSAFSTGLLADFDINIQGASHRNDAVIVNIPYIYDDVISGNYLFIFSNEVLVNESRQLIKNSVILLLIFLIIGGTTAYYFSNKVSKRLLNTSVQVKELFHMVSDQPEKMAIGQKNNSDEIDLLNSNIGEMKSAIIRKIDLLENQYGELKNQNFRLEQGFKKETANIDKKTAKIKQEVQDIAGMIYHQIHTDPTSNYSAQNNKDYLTIKKEGESKMIPLADISCIQIDEHLYTVFYMENNLWKQCNSFGSLSLFEKEYRGFFTRINRSVLINPAMIENITHEKKVVFVKLISPDISFRVSRANKKIILKYSKTGH